MAQAGGKWQSRLGPVLRDMRVEARLTQEALAEKLGDVSQETISHLERHQSPSIGQLFAIEQACGKPRGWSLRKAGLIEDPVDVEAAIAHDVHLADRDRRLILATYKAARRPPRRR